MFSRISRASLLKCGLAGVFLLGMTGCDRTEERTERVSTLGQAVLDQIMGRSATQDPERQLAAAPLDARAYARKKEALPSVSGQASRPVRYVIGSIVAKPRDMPAPLYVADIQSQPEKAFDVVVDDRAEAKLIIPDAETLKNAEADPEIIDRLEKSRSKKRPVTVIDPRILSAPAPVENKDLPRLSLKKQIELKQIAEGSLPQRPVRPPIVIRPETAQMRAKKLPKLSVKTAQRARTMQTSALKKQVRAEDQMIETISKYKLAASIQRSRSGQMVMEIGADALEPTALSHSSGMGLQQRSSLVLDNNATCPPGRSSASSEDPQRLMQCVIDDLKATGEFEYVEKDYVFEHQMMRFPSGETSSALLPDDPLFQYQWNFRNKGEAPDEAEGGSGFVDFWTRSRSQGSYDVTVAVIDTGLQLNHPDILASTNIMPGWDMVSDPDVGNDGDSRDSNPEDPGDLCPERGIFANTYHGTHVAGIVGAGASNNKTGIAGGAWTIQIVPVRALGKCGGRLSDINDAIRWAAGTIPEYDVLGNEVWNENPADIINLSIGLFRSCPASMQDAIDAVTAEGVIVVAAAGNDAVTTDYYAPAGCRNVLTVAGGDARGHLAPYSNYGDAVDLIAPGGDLTRDDDADGNPDGILSMKTSENCIDPVTGKSISQCYYAYEQGTSMAAPHIAAALALIKTAYPEMNSETLVSTLLSGVSSVSPEQCAGACNLYPDGVPMADDPDMCLRPCGAGQLNLANIKLPG